MNVRDNRKVSARNGQSRDIGNTVNIIHRTAANKTKTKHTDTYKDGQRGPQQTPEGESKYSRKVSFL